MADDTTVDQQQLQSTLDDAWRKVTDIIKAQLGTIQVDSDQKLGVFSTIDALADAPVGDQSALLQAIGLGALVDAINGEASDVRSALGLGVAATGDAATVRNALGLKALAQLEQLSDAEVGDVATLRSNLGLDSAATQPDSRYVKLAGNNDFDTMPMVGGIPIVERGENSNGQYIRYADGTQICMFLESEKVSNWEGVIGGLIHYGQRDYFAFPAAFIEIPYCSTACRSPGGYFGWSETPASGNKADVGIRIVATSEDHSAQRGYIAIGKWK